MRIGFDISQTGPGKAGCGHYAASLLQALLARDRDNKYLLYPHFGPFVWDPDISQTTSWATGPHIHHTPLAETHEELVRLWRKQPEAAEERMGRPDILHANSFFCPTTLDHSRVVYTLYDLSVIDHPQWSSLDNWWTCFSGLLDAAFFSDAVIAISEFSRNRFLEFFPFFPSDRVHVLYPASRFSAATPSDPEIARRLGLGPDRFWLAVGTLEPRKNLRTLARAYTAYLEQGGEAVPLVLAGGQGWLMDQFIEELGQGPLASNVLLAGYVSDPELAWLYRHCLGFAYPSRYEGFGMPVLEAMTLGAAVITSNVTALPEVAGQAALQVSPDDPEELTKAMLRIVHEPGFRDELRRNAPEQAQKFQWTDSAARLSRIYEALPKTPPRRTDPRSVAYSQWWRWCASRLHDGVGELFDRLRGAESQFFQQNQHLQTLAEKLHDKEIRLNALESSRAVRLLRKLKILRV